MHLKKEWPQAICTYHLQQEWVKIQQKPRSYDKGNQNPIPQLGS
jgi:hypothetical protein